jgi:hypothetical protein
MATKADPKFEKLFERVEALLKSKHLVRGGRVTTAEVTATEKAEGRALPPFYVALMLRVGALGKPRRRGHDGTYFLRGHCKVYAPRVAQKLTRELRAKHADGRYAKVLARTFFFVHWQFVNQYYGVDDEGNVRILHVARPGTVLKVESRSIVTTMSKLVAEVEADARDDARS